jgi:hypothetical protein
VGFYQALRIFASRQQSISRDVIGARRLWRNDKLCCTLVLLMRFLLLYSAKLISQVSQTRGEEHGAYTMFQSDIIRAQELPSRKPFLENASFDPLQIKLKVPRKQDLGTCEVELWLSGQGLVAWLRESEDPRRKVQKLLPICLRDNNGLRFVRCSIRVIDRCGIAGNRSNLSGWTNEASLRHHRFSSCQHMLSQNASAC